MEQVLTKYIPKNGTTFISIHEFAGAIWAQTYRYNAKGILESYCEAQDEWIKASTEIDFDDLEGIHIKYYVI